MSKKEEKVIKPKSLEKAEKEVIDHALVQRLAVEEELDTLYDTLSEGGYLGQSYKKDSMVSIPGTLFASFVNLLGNTRKNLTALGNVANVLEGTVNSMQNDQAIMTVSVMAQHKQNVDDGNTITNEQLDKEDAKENIKPIAVSKKKKKKKS